AVSFSFFPSVVHERAHGEIRQYVVIASQLRWQVDVEKVQCLSLNKKIARIFKQDYSSNGGLLSMLQRFFPHAQIEPNDFRCAYVMTFNIVVSDNLTVRYQGQISRMLMSFQVCERDMTEEDLGSKCSYKNLYLFRSGLGPLEAFEVGLKAFLSTQKSEWETI